jgi:hypothetical protein
LDLCGLRPNYLNLGGLLRWLWCCRLLLGGGLLLFILLVAIFLKKVLDLLALVLSDRRFGLDCSLALLPVVAVEVSQILDYLANIVQLLEGLSLLFSQFSNPQNAVFEV